MDSELLPYTSGSFTVRPGEEASFVSAVEDVAEWTMMNYSAAREITLLKEPSRPGRYFTLIRWDDEESIEAWRSDPEFGAYMAQLREHCSTVEVFTLQRIRHFAER